MQKPDQKKAVYQTRKIKNISIKVINMRSVNTKAMFMALLAASLYGISTPLSKLLLEQIPPTLMAALLYLGAGFGMLTVNLIRKRKQAEQKEAKLTWKEMPYVLAMIMLDVAAPILLMFGLFLTTSANAALLNNFEIAATSFLALFLFKEAVGRRMWLAITLITLACCILSIEDITSFSFSFGSIFVLMACICWGFENNCTRMLSIKDPLQIVAIKGFGSGFVALLISLINKQYSSQVFYILMALLLGFVAYGLSIYFYILAQRELGAARTSTYYAAAPFIGVILSWILFREGITLVFVAALLIMLLGTYFAVTEVHKHAHEHSQITHEHKHNHSDGHHTHSHGKGFTGEHSHIHTHETLMHIHSHTPDAHHNHTHVTSSEVHHKNILFENKKVR